MIDYIPEKLEDPTVLNILSAWINNERVLADIIHRFKLNTDIALEFGVEGGFSTTALAYYFKAVIGVDIFKDGDPLLSYEAVREGLRAWPNITLLKSSYQRFIAEADDSRYDMIHVDVGFETHEYILTYECGVWSVQHSDCVIFHDTLSFPAVEQVCRDLASKYGMTFYNYKEPVGPVGIHCGLGILVR